MRILELPGEAVTSLQWDASSGRLALCSWHSVFLAEVQVSRPMWCHIRATLLYAAPAEASSKQSGADGQCVNLLGMHSGEKRAKRVLGLHLLAVWYSAPLRSSTHRNVFSLVCCKTGHKLLILGYSTRALSGGRAQMC